MALVRRFSYYSCAFKGTSRRDLRKLATSRPREQARPTMAEWEGVRESERTYSVQGGTARGAEPPGSKKQSCWNSRAHSDGVTSRPSANGGREGRFAKWRGWGRSDLLSVSQYKVYILNPIRPFHWRRTGTTVRTRSWDNARVEQSVTMRNLKK